MTGQRGCSCWMVAVVLPLVACGRPAEQAEEAYAPQIDPANFVAQVDNEFFPLVPGTNHVGELRN